MVVLFTMLTITNCCKGEIDSQIFGYILILMFQIPDSPKSRVDIRIFSIVFFVRLTIINCDKVRRTS